jgi:hypothetical protein
MLREVEAIDYIRPMSSGRTSPLLLNCERDDGSAIQVVAKFSAFCDQQELHLAREVVGACLAGDLGLPVPEPVIVRFSPDWIETIIHNGVRNRVRASGQLAFGSTLVGPGYSIWRQDTMITEAMIETATGILAFDALTQNFDRRDGNPNCLVKGENLRIFDHEQTFAHRLTLGWRPPWQAGGSSWMERKGNHIFLTKLKRLERCDLKSFGERFEAISDDRLEDYRAALPTAWLGHVQDLHCAFQLIHDCRENIGDCLREIQRVLT